MQIGRIFIKNLRELKETREIGMIGTSAARLCPLVMKNFTKVYSVLLHKEIFLKHMIMLLCNSEKRIVAIPAALKQ